MLFLPPKSFLLSVSLRRLIAVFQAASWLIIYLDRDIYVPNAVLQKPFPGSLGIRFGSVGLCVRLILVVAPANGECAIHQRHYVASCFLRLRRCFLRSALLVIWILDRAAKQLKTFGKLLFNISIVG